MLVAVEQLTMNRFTFFAKRKKLWQRLIAGDWLRKEKEKIREFRMNSRRAVFLLLLLPQLIKCDLFRTVFPLSLTIFFALSRQAGSLLSISFHLVFFAARVCFYLCPLPGYCCRIGKWGRRVLLLLLQQKKLAACVRMPECVNCECELQH